MSYYTGDGYDKKSQSTPNTDCKSGYTIKENPGVFHIYRVEPLFKETGDKLFITSSTDYIFSYETQCETKHQYDNKIQARHAKKSMQKKIGKHLIVYHCPHCNYWHIGNPVGKTYRKPHS